MASRRSSRRYTNVYFFAEDVTWKCQIIKIVTMNKICSKHDHLLDESDANHVCNPGVCGANLAMQHPIGDQYTWASGGMACLLSQGGVEVKEVTTDPDSDAVRAGESLFKDGLLTNQVTHYLDTGQLGISLKT